MSDWQDPMDLSSPFLVSWWTSVPTGIARQGMFIDAPQAQGNAQLFADAFVMMLANVWAPLATLDSAVIRIETANFKDLNNQGLATPQNLKGTQFGGTSHIKSSMCWTLLTEDHDRWARRRLYWPGTPSSWTHEGRLTNDALGPAQSRGRGFISALGRERQEYTLAAFIYRPALPGDRNPQFHRAGVRRILGLRINTNLDEPPTLIGGS